MNSLRTEVTKVLKNAKPPKSNISQEERKALKELSKDNDIVIVPADKGRSTVVMNRKDYNSKMNKLLEDRTTYLPLKKDPTKSVKNQLVDLLKKWKQQHMNLTNYITNCIPLQRSPKNYMGYRKSIRRTRPLDPLFPA